MHEAVAAVQIHRERSAPLRDSDEKILHMAASFTRVAGVPQ